MKRLFCLIGLVLGVAITYFAYTAMSTFQLCVRTSNIITQPEPGADEPSGGYFLDVEDRAFPFVGATCRWRYKDITAEQAVLDWPLTAATILGILIAAASLIAYFLIRSKEKARTARS